MTSYEHSAAPAVESIEQDLRDAFRINEKAYRSFAEDGFHEQLMERLVASIDARRRRERSVLMAVGFVSALAAAVLAGKAVSSMATTLAATKVDAGFEAALGDSSIAPFLGVVCIFIVWLFVERLNDEYV